MPRTLFTLTVGLLALCSIAAQANPAYWSSGEWPKTDFTKHSIEFTEIISGGPPKDGIPPIDDPVFQSVIEAAKTLSASEPVIALVINGKAKASDFYQIKLHTE